MISRSIVRYSLDHPRLVTCVMGVITLALAAFIPRVKVDTDPENMLSAEEFVRRFHQEKKEQFALHDMVVLGVVNEKDPDGVFNPASLEKVHRLTEFAKTLRWDAETGERIRPAPSGTTRPAPEAPALPGGLDAPAGGPALPPGLGGEPSESGVPARPLGSDGAPAPADAAPSPRRETVGVVEKDLLSPSTVDHIEQVRRGEVRLEWLMPEPPKTREEARAIRDRAKRVHFLDGTLVSEDGKALCLYLPLTHKDLSHRVYRALREEVAAYGGDEQYHITGLPVAEDTFGVEMFKQMAISAPLAMLIIFLLLWFFFRKVTLILPPMILAMISVICTMGLLIGMGYTVHIMSSMIPIFLMPISVLDSTHILSEFFDRYPRTKDRRSTVLAVMDELFVPMLYTSLTTVAGFASLALTPIPPVQVFGAFVAIGVMLAWVFTVTFIPASIMFIRPRSLEGFGARRHEDERPTPLSRGLFWMGRATNRYFRPILLLTAIVAAVAAYGITRIRINDNPVKWFTPSHPIRVADRVLNEHFGGTYMAYLALDYEPPAFDARRYAADLAGRAERRAVALAALADRIPVAAKTLGEPASRDEFLEALEEALQPDILEADDETLSVWAAFKPFLDAQWDAPVPTEGFAPAAYADALHRRARQHAEDVGGALRAMATDLVADVLSPGPGSEKAFLDALAARVEAAPGGTGPSRWAPVSQFIAEERQRGQVFKDPKVLEHVAALQATMAATDVVGKSNSLADIVKTIHRDLLSGEAEDERIPATRAAVGQCLVQFESGHRPDDLWHFVEKPDEAAGRPGFQQASLWVQLTSGDNRDMERVVRAVDEFFAAHPAPVALTHRWFGLTYINVVWQEKMVWGMLQSLLGGFLVVFLMMVILFRSAAWGLLSMLPLTVTISFIYGLIGLAGKDYDMPVAVLSALTLGLAVDFAIHFLARSRRLYVECGSWERAAPAVFGEPARAITRNVIVIAVGFLPLLAAPLMPYKTVGFFIAAILAVSGLGTLFILPALVRAALKVLFPAGPVLPLLCRCGTCIVSAAALVVAVAVNVYQFQTRGTPTTLTWVSLIAVVLLASGCFLLSRRRACGVPDEERRP